MATARSAAVAAAALGLILCAGISAGQGAGEEVCFVGYIMDSYCINRGRLLDKPTLDSLQHPDQHSVHCLVDVPICRDGGYEVLADPPGTNGTATGVPHSREAHCRAFKLDGAGNDKVVQLAREIGDCSTCNGPGTLKNGFRATVRGKLQGSGKLPTLAVTELLPASAGCPGGATVLTPENLDCSSGEDQPWIAAHATCMLLGWGILLPLGVISAHFLRHRPNGLWFKIHRPMQMAGLSVAFIGWMIAIFRFDVFSAGPKKNLSFVHGTLGMVVMTLGLLQPINAFFRPHNAPAGEPKPTARRLWEYLHKGSGYGAVVLAVVTIFIGVTRPARKEVQTAFLALYIVVLVCLVSVAAGMYMDGRAHTLVKAKNTDI